MGGSDLRVLLAPPGERGQVETRESDHQDIQIGIRVRGLLPVFVRLSRNRDFTLSNPGLVSGRAAPVVSGIWQPAAILIMTVSSRAAKQAGMLSRGVAELEGNEGDWRGGGGMNGGAASAAAAYYGNKDGGR